MDTFEDKGYAGLVSRLELLPVTQELAGFESRPSAEPLISFRHSFSHRNAVPVHSIIRQSLFSPSKAATL